jgi:hypothetical protein
MLPKCSLHVYKIVHLDCIQSQLNPVHTFTTFTPKNQECLGAQTLKFLMQFIHSPVTFSLLCPNICIITNNILMVFPLSERHQVSQPCKT